MVNLFPSFQIRDKKSGNSVQSEVIDALDANTRSVVLIGDAGVGKTTTMLSLVKHFAERIDVNLVKQNGLSVVLGCKIPLYFEFRSISTFQSIDEMDKFCLKKIRQLFTNDKFDSLRSLLNIPETRWVFFLDGIDEIRNRKIAGPILKEWLELLPSNVNASTTPILRHENLGIFKLKLHL
jgi:hypothetical protein